MKKTDSQILQASAKNSVTRNGAYTTPRQDVFDMVPTDAEFILDVGCSNGALGRSLMAARPGRHVFGIEFDSTFAREASTYLENVIHADLNLLDWRQAFDDRLFDCLIFADVLEHLIEPSSCLRQACQHLKSDGCIVISLPNIRHISAFKSIFIDGSFPQRDRGIFDRTHMRWFTTADAHTLIESCGLIISAQSATLRWGDVGGGIVNRLLNKLPRKIQNWTVVREFFGYQVCFRASRAPEIAVVSE